MSQRQSTQWILIPVVLYSVACATGQPALAQLPPASQVAADTLDPNYVPVGFGSLRQDAIAIKVAPSSGLQVRAVPMNEQVIRLLSPDSYRALNGLITSKQQELDQIKQRNRLPSYSIWYVSFYGLEQGETRFSPQEFIISNTGRDFRPIDILPLSGGFGEFRLRQRETQSALFVFDGQIDINQPTTAKMEGVSSVTDWTRVLQDIERERSLVRSRAAAAKK